MSAGQEVHISSDLLHCGAPFSIYATPQVLMEIAGETLEQLAGSAAPRHKQKVKVTQAAEVAPEEDEALQARLDAVRS